MILYKNTKVKSALWIETDYFDIVAGVLQGDTLVPYLFTIYLDYVLRTSIKDADDIALQANTLAQAETLRHSLERTAAGIGFRVNVDKSE